MTRKLLDTTFLIDAERADDQLELMISDDDDVAIAAITAAELLVGVALAAHSRRRQRQSYVNSILGAIPLIDYDRAIAVEHAELLVAVRKAGRPRGAHDLIIAATARATKRTVVTADRTAFADLPGITLMDHR